MMPVSPPKVGPVYELVKTVEFDVEIGDDQFVLRIELFRTVSDIHTFRAHIWRTEMYRIQSSFPRDQLTDKPAHLPSDEVILVDLNYLTGDFSNFQAENQEIALQLVMHDFQDFLTRIAGPGE